MDVATLAASMSIVKDLNSFWKGLTGNDKDKVDSLIRKASEKFLPSDADLPISEVRAFLTKGTDDAASRITAAVMHPATREYFGELIDGPKGPSHIDQLLQLPSDILVYCKTCQAPNHVQLYKSDERD